MARMVTSINIDVDLYKKCKQMKLLKGISKSELINLALIRLFNTMPKGKLTSMVKSRKRTEQVIVLKKALKRLR